MGEQFIDGMLDEDTNTGKQFIHEHGVDELRRIRTSAGLKNKERNKQTRSTLFSTPGKALGQEVQSGSVRASSFFGN